VGFSPNIKQRGDAAIVSSTTDVVHSYELEYGSSLPVGATVEFRFWKPFSIIAGGMWSPRSDGELTDNEDGVTLTTAGTNLWLAKAGLAIRMREARPSMQMRRLNGSIFVAAAVIRDAGKDDVLAPTGVASTVDHTGVNFGAEGELPAANNRLAFTLGLEDWMISWNHNHDYIQRINSYFHPNTTARAVYRIDTNQTHLWILRAGLAFRF
jgi:hypothetical protein